MISRLAIKNYRSLRNVELRPGPLTVLIGPNGAGKSNIIDALRFVNTFVWNHGGLSKEVEQRGGWAELVWGGKTDAELSIEFAWKQGEGLQGTYSTTMSKRHLDGVPRHNENVSINGRTAHITHAGGRIVGVFESPLSVLDESADSEKIRDNIPPMQMKRPDWTFYDLSPAAARGARPVRREYRLDSDGGNLATVVHTLFSDGAPELDEAVDMLQVCVPTVEKLVSPIFGEGQTYVALREKGVPEPIGSWGLSDGTLLALSIAIALITPNVPDLICIESPEDGIHPQMLETIADMLEVASRHTQVIVTSQSPHLLNWLPYDAFVVVDKEDGATTLTPLKDKDELRQVAKDLGTGDAWYSGHLGGEP